MFGKNASKQSDMEYFTIYDSKSRSYNIPWTAPNKDVLMREIINMFKRPEEKENQYLTNAEDYSLFRCGTFDKKTGIMEAQPLEHIANLHDLRALILPDYQTRALSST